MKCVPVLYSERLVLREIEEKDTDFIVNIRSDPQIYQYFLNPHQITKEEHLIWFHQQYAYDANRINWLALTKDMEQTGLFGVQRENVESNKAEISYILHPNHYGKGYAKEAVERIIEYCRHEWHSEWILAEIHENNHSSIQFVEKMGFEVQSYCGHFLTYMRLS